MRLFLAITLDPAIKSALQQVQERFRRFGKAIRPVTEEQMHLTLKFLGDVPDTDAAEVSAAVEEVAAGCAPFEFAVRGLGCFPQRGAPRVIWAGVEDQTGLLQACHQTSEAVWTRLGFTPENRPFSPHLTLGRVKNPAVGQEIRALLAEQNLEAGTQHVDQLVLYQSVLTPAGATYRLVTRADLDTSSSDKPNEPTPHENEVPSVSNVGTQDLSNGDKP